MVVDHLHATIKTTKFVLKEKERKREREVNLTLY